jgi:hypothetical protein
MEETHVRYDSILPLWNMLPPLTFWFLPAAIGLPIITRAVIAARSKHSQTDHVSDDVAAR